VYNHLRLKLRKGKMVVDDGVVGVEGGVVFWVSTGEISTKVLIQQLCGYARRASLTMVSHQHMCTCESEFIILPSAWIPSDAPTCDQDQGMKE
jgi:hypothetical protein